MRRVGWHRYATGVQAAEESRNEVEAGRIDQQHALAGKAHVLQASRDGSGPPIELGVGQTGVIALAVEQMDKGRLPRAFVGVAAQHADQVAGKLMRTNVGLGVNRHCLVSWITLAHDRCGPFDLIEVAVHGDDVHVFDATTGLSLVCN